MLRSNTFLFFGGVALSLFSVFLLMTILDPGNETAKFWMQTCFSIGLVITIINQVLRKGEKYQKGIDAMNSLIPITAGGFLIGIGLMALISSLLGTDLGMGMIMDRWAGALFITLGSEIILITIAALKSTKDSKRLIITIGTCFAIDFIAAFIVSAFMGAPFVSAITFLLLSTVVTVALMAALGARLKIKETYTVEKSLSFFMNSFFMGLVFLVIILSVAFPAYYILLNSGGYQVSTLLGVQNPLIEGFLQETGASIEATKNFLLSLAMALSPVDFQTLTIDFGAFGILATIIWTGVLGLSAEGVPTTHILATEAFLAVFFILTTGLVREGTITFRKLEKIGEEGWVLQLIRKLKLKKEKEKAEGLQDEQ